MADRWAARLALAAIVVPLGCAGSRERATVTDSSASIGRSVDTSPAASPGWRRVDWEPHTGLEPGDVGVGVVYLRPTESTAAVGTVDTLLLRATPDPVAPALGAMLFVVEPNGVWRYAVAAADSLRPNLLEYGYEESGVPFDSTDASGRWVRALLGATPSGEMLAGWVDTGSPRVGTDRWATRLAEQMLFVPEGARATFFATPDSSQPAPPPASGIEYALHPVEVRGPWMQVRVVQPSDNCVDPDSIPRTTRTLWIRYLDHRGRPTIWYYTRGC